ncbi:MAG: Dam family site-specific DNA-(adenine-N6)-methyltransferase [Deltaproteobacteria bacterium]|nr:MAG: Dam family site-specific DNA-(adenine-N6)-methyltransferase [Deltaproteobacteria bacterium]
MKPLLKWAGGKRRLAEAITRVFPGPCAGTYFEPFCGGASVFLRRRALGTVERAVLSDANPRLIAMYQAVRDDVEGVLDALQRLPSLEDGSWRDAYYDVRSAFNACEPRRVDQAARLIWLNKTCYNGLYRESVSTGFNVPVGRYKAPRLPKPEHVRRVSELLQGAELYAASFEQVMARAGEGDQIYCDPPYVPLDQPSNFTAYSKGGFDLDAQRALASAAKGAAARGAVVVLSNHDTRFVRRELYSAAHGFEVVSSFGVRRSIGRDPVTRKPVREILCRIGS